MADTEAPSPLHLPVPSFGVGKQGSLKGQLLQKPETLTDFSSSYSLSTLIPQGAKMGLHLTGVLQGLFMFMECFQYIVGDLIMLIL